MIKISIDELNRYNELNDVLIDPDNARFFTGLTNSEYDELEFICKKLVDIEEMVCDHDSKQNLYKIIYTFNGLPVSGHYAYVYSVSKKAALLELLKTEPSNCKIAYIITVHNAKGGE